MKIKGIGILALVSVWIFWQCKPASEESSQEVLPKLGNWHVDDAGDTVYHQIAEFAFINQEGDTVSNQDVKGKVYVADFFFTSCPTICPIMKKEMLHMSFG